MYQKVEDVILQDRRVKISVIAHELGISAGWVSSIIHSALMLWKVSSRWVPRMLTSEQKACRQQLSEQNLDMLRPNPENFFSSIITWKMSPSSWPRDQKGVHAIEKQGVPYSQEISCARNSRKDFGNSFLGLRRCSPFGIHATPDNHYWRQPMLRHWWPYARI